jgi:hypothetical protein
VVYLVGQDDEKPAFVYDEWLRIDGPVSCRFLSYLVYHYEKDSRWIMQVDDDSCTDIDRTLEIIDSFYESRDPVVLMGSYVYVIHDRLHLSYNMDDCLQEALKRLDIENMFLGTSNINEFEIIPRFKHSWEQSMVSSGAAERIKESKKTREFLDLCLEVKPQYGDQVPYVAAKIAKVPVDECFIFCPLPIASEYTAINKKGRYTHIHHVLNFWDEFNNFKNALQNGIQFENKKEAEKALHNDKIPDTFWRVVRPGHGRVLKLKASGLIGGNREHEEFSWRQAEDELFMFDEMGEKTYSLKKVSKDTFEGSFLKGQSQCVLKKMDIISLIGMPELAKD